MQQRGPRRYSELWGGGGSDMMSLLRFYHKGYGGVTSNVSNDPLEKNTTVQDVKMRVYPV